MALPTLSYEDLLAMGLVGQPPVPAQTFPAEQPVPKNYLDLNPMYIGQPRDPVTGIPTGPGMDEADFNDMMQRIDLANAQVAGVQGAYTAPQAGGASPPPAQPQPIPTPAPQIPPPATAQPEAAPSMANVLGMPQPQEAPVNPMPAAVVNDVQKFYTPAADERAVAERVPKWNSIMEKLKDPMVRGPLETFFAALSAPMAPWENDWSRLGRAASLYNMHKVMLEENARNQPYEDRMKEAEVSHKEAQARGAKATAEKTEGEVKFNQETFDARVQEAKQKLANAILAGDEGKLDVELKQLQVKLQKEFGPEKARMEIQKLRSEIQENGNQAWASAELAKLRGRTDPNLRGLAGMKQLKPVETMTVSEAVDEVNSLSQAFYGSGAGTDSKADFVSWVKENYDDTYNVRLNQLIKRIQSAGGTVSWPQGGKNMPSGTTPSGGKKSYNWDEIKD